jgi:hypothetical protein
MSRRAGATQADIARAIKAARAAGLVVSRVEVDGPKIVILTADEQPKAASRIEDDAAALDRALGIDHGAGENPLLPR